MKGNFDPRIHKPYTPGTIDLECCTIAGLIKVANVEVLE